MPSPLSWAAAWPPRRVVFSLRCTGRNFISCVSPNKKKHSRALGMRGERGEREETGREGKGEGVEKSGKARDLYRARERREQP